MAKQHLKKLWKNFETLHSRFEKNKISEEKLQEDVAKLLQSDAIPSITESLTLILLSKHDDMLEAELFLKNSLENNAYSSFDNKEKHLFVDPIAVIRFYRQCSYIDLSDSQYTETQEAFCKASFLKQLSLLPSKLFFFLIILKQLAISANITQVNYTEGKIPLNDISFYQTFLWAFNTLEQKIERIHGVNIRTAYGITWHQSQWVDS